MTRQHMRCTEITRDLCMCSIDSLGDNIARRSLNIGAISMNDSRPRSRECRHQPHLTCPLRARCFSFGTAHKVSELSPSTKLSGHARARVLRRERQHLVVEASGKSRMRSQRHCEAFLHCAFWVSCLALHHHEGTGTTPALGVMIATHDSFLIVQSAGRDGTVKQRQCIVR